MAAGKEALTHSMVSRWDNSFIFGWDNVQRHLFSGWRCDCESNMFLMVNYPLLRIDRGLRITPAAWEWNQHPGSGCQMIPLMYVLIRNIRPSHVHCSEVELTLSLHSSLDFGSVAACTAIGKRCVDTDCIKVGDTHPVRFNTDAISKWESWWLQPCVHKNIEWRTKGRGALSAMAIICSLGEAGEIVVDQHCKSHVSMNLLRVSFVSVNLHSQRDQSKYGCRNSDSQGGSALFLLIYGSDNSCASHWLSRTDCWVQHYGKGPYAWLITAVTLAKQNPKVTSIP